MYRIEAIIRPYLLDAVRDQLQQINVQDFTVTECKGTGQPEVAHRFRGSLYSHGLVPRVHIMAVVLDDQLEQTIEALRQAASTGDVGDGKIFISQIHQVVRIRTNERGEAALS